MQGVGSLKLGPIAAVFWPLRPVSGVAWDQTKLTDLTKALCWPQTGLFSKLSITDSFTHSFGTYSVPGSVLNQAQSLTQGAMDLGLGRHP